MSTYHIFFGKLANPLKIQILVSLRDKEKSVQDLSKDLGIEQSKLSHALSSLKACSIVSCKRIGKNMIYSLNKETILPMLNLIDKHEKKFCPKCSAGRKR